ncbi:MAG: VPLPA-CTERM sorting domain-containing protein [Methylococcaceae bacterium]|nr:VPLPA-CTERM sorting domain-containing protein [Methylococcaceae bacterium]
MKAKVILATSLLAFASMPIAHASQVTYDVTAIFDEPQLGVGHDTEFTGSFTWDTVAHSISGLTGWMNSSMSVLQSAPNLHLTNQLTPSSSDGAGGVKATTFLLPTTDVFMGGGYTTGGMMTMGNQNAYFTLDVNPLDPTNVLASNVNALVYGDCTSLGLMGATMCMTGHSLGSGGTMGAKPLSLTITQQAPVPVPAAIWLLGSALAGAGLVGRRQKSSLS